MDFTPGVTSFQRAIDCNGKKRGSDWRDFIIQRAGPDAAERHARMREFLREYPYKPGTDLSAITAELYDEVGEIAMTVIKAKIKRVRPTL